jgi:hypothetical protein
MVPPYIKIQFIAILIFFLGLSAVGQNFMAGQQYDTVRCIANQEQSYSLFLPETYPEKDNWPVLYIFEPAARGPYAVRIFKPLADKYGYIIIASNNSRNGSWDIVFDAAEAMFTDSFSRFKIDTARVYLAGFSGGARAATTIATITNKVAGVISCGAGFSMTKRYQPNIRNNFIYYGLIGTRDMNYLETMQVKTSLDKINIKNRLHVFDGPHRWPPINELSYAFDWMEINASNVEIEEKAKSKWLVRADSLFTAEEYLLYQTEINDINTLFSQNTLGNKQRADSLLATKAYRTELRSKEKWQNRAEGLTNKYLQALNEMPFTRLAGSDSTVKDMTWWQNEVKMLNKYVKSKDLYKSRMASRLLNLITANCAENMWSYVELNDMETAIKLTRLWLYISPEQIWPNWTAVRIYALNNDRKNTIKYIKKSVDLGINPTRAMLNNPNLNFVKNSDAYASLASLVK